MARMGWVRGVYRELTREEAIAQDTEAYSQRLRREEKEEQEREEREYQERMERWERERQREEEIKYGTF